MDENNEQKNIRAWWEPAVEIFTQVSGWIAGPIILALVLGKYLDGRFGTRPWIFIGMSLLGFLISSVGIVKVVSKYMKRMEEESKKENKK